jgi:tight adherence protein C
MKFSFLVCILGLTFWCIYAPHSRAENCGEDFERIDERCLKKFEGKFKQASILISETNPESIVGQVYFYKTSLGHLGKLKILSASFSKGDLKNEIFPECNIYFDLVTFTESGSFAPSNILSIKSEYGVWQEDVISLDKAGNHDLKLVKEAKGCAIYPLSSKIVSYKKLVKSGALSSQGSSLLFYASLFLIGLAVFLVAKSTLEEEDRFKATEALEETETKDKVAQDFILKYSRPFFKRYFTPIVQGLKGRNTLKNRYKKSIANAGLTKELTPEDFFAFKLFLIIGFPILFITLRILLSESWPMSYIPILAVAGFFYPDLWLSGKKEKRKRDIVAAMPFIVDMLALSVEAGLDFMAAIQKVLEKAPPSALTDEFEILIKETKIGSSRAEGLRQLAWRVDILVVNSFCATLIATDSVGGSLAPILKQLSNDVRQKKAADAEKQGATAATKILFPTIMLIMPAVFIAIAGPLLVKMVSGD